MATTKNITMKQFNGTDYDTLYPKTKVEQVEGAYTKQQILTSATAALYGLGASAVPDDVLATARSLISTAQSTADSKCKIMSGSYVGTGTYGKDNKNSLTFDEPPKMLIVTSSANASYGSTRSYDLLLYISGFNGLAPSSFTNTSDGFYIVTISGSGNTVSWYSTGSAEYQLNKSGVTYNYIVAI